jgi:hypothetical protein
MRLPESLQAGQFAGDESSSVSSSADNSIWDTDGSSWRPHRDKASSVDLQSVEASAEPRLSSIDGNRKGPKSPKISILGARLKAAYVAWPNGGKELRFIPDAVLRDLVTVQAIEQEIKDQFPEDQVTKVLMRAKDISNAPKLFTILVLIGEPQTICVFLDAGLGDKDLPFKKFVYPQETAVASENRAIALGIKNSDREDTPVEAFEYWYQEKIVEFFKTQWAVLAPVFDTLGKHYELDTDSILPFIDDLRDQNAVKVGGYSTVWPARIHSTHQKVLQSENSTVCITCSFSILC